MDYLDKPWLKQYPRTMQYDVDVPAIPVYRLVDDAIKQYAQETALIFYGTKISYEELGNYIEQMTSALHTLGIKQKSVVAIYVPTCPQFIIAYYAAQKLGAIPTAVNFLFSPREIELVLKDSGADTIIMIDLLYNKLKPVIQKLGIKTVILTDILYFMPYLKRKLAVLLRRMPKAKIPKDAPVQYLEDLLKGEGVPYPKVEIDPKTDTASIIYTSGTTGTPKGIELTHQNIVACIAQVRASSGDAFEKSKYLLSYLPFFHIYGQNVMMTGGLSMGQTLILILRPKFDELLKYIQKYKIRMFFGVPAIFRILIKLIKSGKYDLSSLQLCACGSDYASQALKDEWKDLTGVEITEGYGLTEACPATGVPIGGEGKTGSVGLPLPGTMVAIADPERDAFLKIGERGEIVVSGPQVMKGYWNGEGDKYPHAFATIAGKRWVRTGDIGSMDTDGYFYMVERKKDIIKYKAHTIYPGEVETVLSEYAPIQDIAVVGIPANDPEYGQIVKAFIVLKDEYKDTITKDDIVEYCRDKLAIYKIPKQLKFVEELPKNAMGKVIRKELRDK